MAGESETVEPTLRNRHQRFDQAGQVFLQKTKKLEKKSPARKSQEEKDKKQPPGGFDATLPQPAPPGYTLKFTFHRARHLPFADINTLSSDPYVIATLKTDLPKRHKEDPDLRFRTPTIHRNTDPEWNAEWVVANVPASGFFLKCRLYDEDPADHDDRLGNVDVFVSGIGDSWPGIKEQTFEVKMRTGSKRAYLVRGCATLFSWNLKLRGEMDLSVENLGKTPGESGSKAYTIGLLYWSRHFSPLIGRLTGIEDSDDATDQDKKKKTRKYKSVIFSRILTICGHHLLTFSPAFKPSKCNSLVRYPMNSITAMSSLSPLSPACSRHTLCVAGYSTAFCVISTLASTTTIAQPSMASSKNPASK
jgi:hypothetical protein